jgi:hypothetical protein
MAGDLDYAVYRGTLGDFISHVPRRCSTGGFTSASMRTIDDAVYFIVVPLSASREGSYGVDGNGTPRPQGSSPCRQQSVGKCP